MRLHHLQAHLGDRFKLTTRAYPLIADQRAARRLTPHGMISRLRAGIEAEREGLPCRAWPEAKPVPSSSMPALIAAKCAWFQGAEAFARYDLALYGAYFAECRDISQTETLVELAAAVGLERSAFLAAFERDEAREQVLADLGEYRRRYGAVAPGIPLLDFNDGRPVIGCAPIETYYAAIDQRLGKDSTNDE